MGCSKHWIFEMYIRVLGVFRVINRENVFRSSNVYILTYFKIGVCITKKKKQNKKIMYQYMYTYIYI